MLYDTGSNDLSMFKGNLLARGNRPSEMLDQYQKAAYTNVLNADGVSSIFRNILE